MLRPFLAPNLRQAFEPAITPLFRTWWRFSRGMTLGVRGVACDEEGRIALIRHTYRAGWFLPGGGVESGETLEQAVIKEMAEEASIHATASPRLFAVYANHANYKNDHVALFVFDAFEARPFTPNSEVAELGFFPLSDLPPGLTKASRVRLAEIFENAPIAAHW